MVTALCCKRSPQDKNRVQPLPLPNLSPKPLPEMTTSEPSIRQNNDGKFHFSIDRGGTFTDVHCILPDGSETVTKLLSEDPDNYPDAPTEGIRRLLQRFDTPSDSRDGDDGDDDSGGGRRLYQRGTPVYTGRIGSIRMGTTVATNALLERRGERMGLLISKGFRDLLRIGNQSRSHIFDLTCSTPDVLYEDVKEVEERVMLASFVSESAAAAAAANEEEEEDKDGGEEPPTHTTAQAGIGPRSTGITGEQIIALQPPNLPLIQSQLQEFADAGIKSIAIVLIHSYTYPQHEQAIEALAKRMNCFTEISTSSSVMPMVRMVGRGHTACAAAYLTPKIAGYLSSFRDGFDDGLDRDVLLTFMKSDGGLAPADDFGGHQAILSGPAGGVVGYAKTAYKPPPPTPSHPTPPPPPIIGFDMGGTSTDVSRYSGTFEHVFETTIASTTIQAPQLDIQTVAAGGGSRLFLRDGLYIVGPESAGAHPGPVCYRKEGGVLAVTDANVVLGRVIPEFFPRIFGRGEDEGLWVEGARGAFEELLGRGEGEEGSVEEMAFGFLKVANEAMCRPIRNLTQMKGFDLTTHKLACFGGAGPQHACAMAKSLGIKHVFIHRYGGILSAYGLSMADAVQEERTPTADIYSYHNNKTSDPSKTIREERLSHLAAKATKALVQQGYNEEDIVVERYVNLRYQGTDNAVMIQEPSDGEEEEDLLPYEGAFRAHYKREFGFDLEGRDILIDDYRVRAIVPGESPDTSAPIPDLPPPPADTYTKAYFENGWEENVPVYKTESLKPGHVFDGPAIVVQSISTIVLELDCTARVTSDGDLDITIHPSNGTNSSNETKNSKSAGEEEVVEETIQEDPVQLSIFSHRFMGIAEQMGRTLQRTAISVNVKERLDFSCALFTAHGGLVANAPHIPVHLGAMQEAVRFQLEFWNSEGREGIQEGDVFCSNHPHLAGGSHLPDITVITPVFHCGEIVFFVASRGHHADVGGITPGSMPPGSKTLVDEGAAIVAFKLVRDGQFQEDGITQILLEPQNIPGNSGTRNLKDNISDLRAQVAANHSGIRLLNELVSESGLNTVQAYMTFIQNNAEHAVRSMLKEFALTHGTRAQSIDYMDDGTPICLTVDIDPQTGSASFDFTGTGPQMLGNQNAPPAITYSAVIYSLRSLVGRDIPLNQGCLSPITFTIPRYSLLNPSHESAVVGGNVTTSQRVVDVVLKAFKACAASQGCMNNLTFGDNTFGYYETIAGGAGAGPTWNGRGGVHTHCTNTRITDPEILERRYPVILREFSLRKGSGGKGKFRGGDGVVREIEPLRPLVMSILSERRVLCPYGLEGGEDGGRGRNLLVKRGGLMVNIGGKCSTELNIGDRLRIETPGGGGYGEDD